MWFLGKKGTFLWGNYHFWVMNDHLWGPSVHVDKSFTKIQARVRPPPFRQCLYFGTFWTGNPSLTLWNIEKLLYLFDSVNSWYQSLLHMVLNISPGMEPTWKTWWWMGSMWSQSIILLKRLMLPYNAHVIAIALAMWNKFIVNFLSL